MGLVIEHSPSIILAGRGRAKGARVAGCGEGSEVQRMYQIVRVILQALGNSLLVYERLLVPAWILYPASCYTSNRMATRTVWRGKLEAALLHVWGLRCRPQEQFLVDVVNTDCASVNLSCLCVEVACAHTAALAYTSNIERTVESN